MNKIMRKVFESENPKRSRAKRILSQLVSDRGKV